MKRPLSEAERELVRRHLRAKLELAVAPRVLLVGAEVAPRLSRDDEQAITEKVREEEAKAKRDAELSHAANVQALLGQLAAVVKYGRGHRFVTYRQADAARRAVAALAPSDTRTK